MFAKVRCYNEKLEEIEDTVADEISIRVFGNGKLLASLYCSPASLKELGAGYVVCEGYASSVDDVSVSGTDVFVNYTQRDNATVPDTKVHMQDVFKLIATLFDSKIWQLTGGTHSAAVKSGDDVYIYEDVSRSCAVDKVVGKLVLQNRVAEILAVTCRLSEVIVRKAANARIPIVASKAAATTAGIRLAESRGVTLIGFVRDWKARIYTHPWRIIKLK